MTICAKRMFYFRKALAPGAPSLTPWGSLSRSPIPPTSSPNIHYGHPPHSIPASTPANSLAKSAISVLIIATCYSNEYLISSQVVKIWPLQLKKVVYAAANNVGTSGHVLPLINPSTPSPLPLSQTRKI